MSQEKTVYFVCGLPRSGSTLLMNILGQNPRCYVTPTSGIMEVLVQTRNIWDRIAAFRAARREEGEAIKLNVLRSILRGYFDHTERPVCFDKGRLWMEHFEMAAALLGGREKVKALVTVRDLREVVASFELLWRKTAALQQPPGDRPDMLRFKTALGRVRLQIAQDSPTGRAFNAIRDAATRGWLDRMFFIEYEALTVNPKATLDAVYNFLGETPFAHDYENVEQITFEDDFEHGYKDLHKIRQKVEPQAPKFGWVFDDAVKVDPVWQDLETCASFWRVYMPQAKSKPAKAPKAGSVGAPLPHLMQPQAQGGAAAPAEPLT